MWHGGRICPWTMWGRICPWMKWDEVDSGANVTLVQGRMWPLLLCGRRNSFRASTLESHFHVLCWKRKIALDDTWMRRSNSHFNQLPGHYGCYGVPLLRCNIHFEQLRRRFGCYVPTAISINFQHAMDATLQNPFRATGKTLRMLRSKNHFNQLPGHYGCYGVPCISSKFEDGLDATLEQSFHSISRMLSSAATYNP